MNVYNRATAWGTFVTIVLLAGMLGLDVWLMDKLPVLQHGLAYITLQILVVALFVKMLRVIFKGGSRSAKSDMPGETPSR
jgi:hypothetical protein